MGNKPNKEYTLKHIIDYNGNEEEFKILNERLDKPFEHELIFEDEQKMKLKYMGQLKDKKYNGRGILYSKYTYDGYFKEGKKDGYFRVYHNNSKILIYQGFFKDDKFEGKGILYDDSLAILVIMVLEQNILEKEFQKGKWYIMMEFL